MLNIFLSQKVMMVAFETLLNINYKLATGGSTIFKMRGRVPTPHIYQRAEHVSSECIKLRELSHSTEIYK